MNSTARPAGKACAAFLTPLVLSLLSFPAAAQVTIHFDPARDLEGFEECLGSEFKSLFPLDTYSALLGNEMGAGQLESVRARWKKDKEEASKKLVAMQADPLGVYLFHLRRRLEAQPYFSRIAFTEERGPDPFVFIVQKPAKEDAGYAARVAGFYAPWLAKIEQLFEDAYVKPLDLKRRADAPGCAIAILATPGDFTNYAPTIGQQLAAYGPAIYDAGLELVVGFEDPFSPGMSPPQQRYPILRKFVRALEHAWFTGQGETLGSMWLNEGLAGYLAYHESLLASALDERRIDKDTLGWIVRVFQQKSRQDVLLYPVLDLVQPGKLDEVFQMVKVRSTSLHLAPPAWQDSLRAFYAQAVLWMHFLHAGQAGKYQDELSKYVRAELSGKGGAEAFRTCFDGTDPAILDREFFEWVLQEHERSFGGAKVDRSLLEGLFEDRVDARGAAATPTDGKAAAGTTATDGRVAPGTVPPAAPAKYPASSLVIDAKDIESLHGLALVRAMRGDLDGARQALETLLAQKPAAPEDARIAREIVRIQELAKLRTGFFESLKSSGAKWSSEHQGTKLIATVQKIEDGYVTLGDNKAGVSKIPLASIDPLEIAKQADKPEEQGGAAAWARWYPYILAGDYKSDRLAKDASSEARDLREDAKSWYPALVRTGQAAQELSALAQSAEPKAKGEAEALCTRIQGLLGTYGDLALVAGKVDELRQLASFCVDRTFSDASIAELMHGAVTLLGEGRVKILYTFKKPEEAEDFKKRVGYLADWIKPANYTDRSEKDSIWTVADGALTGRGAASYGLDLGLAAPMSLRCDYKFIPQMAGKIRSVEMLAGVCDDHKGSFISCSHSGRLDVQDRVEGYVQQSPLVKSQVVQLEQVYHMEIDHDGTQVTTFMDAEKKNQLPCGPRTSGGVFLLMRAEGGIAITRLEIEGRIDPSSTKPLKTSWVAKKLAGLGFK